MNRPPVDRSRTPPRAPSRITRCALFATLALGFACARPASAFDQHRRGFVLEYGLAPSYSTWVVREFDARSQSLTEVGRMRLGAATRFRLGVGISDRVTLTYVNDVAFSLDDRFLYENAFTLNGLTGIGARWYGGPAAPSWHIEGAVGLATMMTPGGSSGSGIDNASGVGFEGAVGREFARGWSVSLVARRLAIEEGQVDRSAFDLVVSRILY